MADSPHAEPTRFDLVSPELALVDPELAAWARARLPDSIDVRAAVALRRLTAAPGESVVAATGRGRVDRRRAAALAGVAVALAATLILADVHVEVGKNGASADRPPAAAGASPAPPDDLPTTTPALAPPSSAPEAQSHPKGKRTEPRPRQLAWAPAPGAEGYAVELYRGNARIFVAETRQPMVVVPASWRLDGVSRSLVPGELRWYVWPLVDGRRATRAIVQATLEIPSS